MASRIPLVLVNGQPQQLQAADTLAPAAIAATGTVTGSNLSGINTGDQTFAGIAIAGSILKVVVAETATQSNVTVTIPSDNTIPQNTEGTQILTGSITPASTANKVLVTVSGVLVNPSSGYKMMCAVFRDSGVNAIYSACGTTS